MSSQDFGIKTAQSIRVPATANLLLDSADRYIGVADSNASPNPFNFRIQRGQQLINGFFTRIGVEEVVMEWCEPNIPSVNNFIAIDVSGLGVQQVDISGGFYTTAGLLSTVQSRVNSAYAPSTIFTIQGTSGTPIFLTSAYETNIQPTRPASALGIASSDPTAYFKSYPIDCPDLRPYRYIDIVCEDLTAVQRVKDSSTAPYPRDVLTRFYFAEDGQETYDELGFPIMMGYKPFNRRKLFNPPKQIRWEQNYPVGNLKFTAYGRGALNNTTLAFPYEPVVAGDTTNWDMTLQLSEN